MSTLTAPRFTPASWGIAIALGSAVVMGLYPPAARAAYGEGANAVFMIVLTTWMRALSLLGFCVIKRKPLFTNTIDIKTAISGGVFQALSIICVFTALIFISGPLVISVVFTSTLMLLLFSVWKGDVVLYPYTIITTLTALFGITFVLDIWHPQQFSLIGGLLAFVAAIATASRAYIYGHLTKTRNPAIVGAEAFLVAAILLTPLVLFFTLGFPHTLYGWISALLGGISLSLGTFGVFYGIAKLGSFKNSLFMKIEPLATLGFSVFIYAETINTTHYIGIFLVITSLIAYQLFDMRQKNKL